MGMGVPGLRTMLDRYGDDAPKAFVETGTHRGATIRKVQVMNLFPVIHTIEVHPDLHQYCLDHANDECRDGNVKYHLGDSRTVLASLIPTYDLPVCWYLDAHLDPTVPVSANDFPLWDELDLIEARGKADIVIVDDVHAFGRATPAGWDHVSKEAILEKFGDRVRDSYEDTDAFILFLTEKVKCQQPPKPRGSSDSIESETAVAESSVATEARSTASAG